MDTTLDSPIDLAAPTPDKGDPFAGLTPAQKKALIQKILHLQTIEGQQGLQRSELEQIHGLQAKPAGPQHFSPAAAAIGGIGDTASALILGMKERGHRKEQERLMEEREAAMGARAGQEFGLSPDADGDTHPTGAEGPPLTPDAAPQAPQAGGQGTLPPQVAAIIAAMRARSGNGG